MKEHTYQPLAAQLRPDSMGDFLGQAHLLSAGKPLYEAIVQGKPHSMILWGPPGTGKTTLARLLAANTSAEFITLSAVLSGVKDIREAVARAQKSAEKTILFVDEVHRFNKAQQDAFLPFVEDGTIIFVGATTENPSFEVISALLSRTRVYVLKALTVDDLVKIINNALHKMEYDIEFSDDHKTLLAHACDGDARRCLNYLEIIMELAQSKNMQSITQELINEVISGGTRRFDKGGDIFYDQISALHKSVRGTDPDAALYWFCRMLDGGCDPRYIARRMLRMASEDIGNADPRALQLTLNAADTYERLGSPEGELALAQALIYLACAPKSNASYVAFNHAMADAKQYGTLDVPLHIRNAPTQLMKNLGYGKDYHYAHHYGDAYVKGENYFPENMPQTQYYQPTDRGLEIKIKEKLTRLKSTS